MKNLTKILLIFTMSYFLTSCLNLDLKTGISGMGETSGNLEVKTPFNQIPQADSIELSGLSPIDNESYNITSIIQNDTDNSLLKGAGGSFQNESFHPWIIVKITICNKSNRLRHFFFPPGLLFQVNNQEYQNGILMSPVYVYVFPYQCRTINLLLFCINKSRHGSSKEINYTILGTTNSTKMNGLIKNLEHKDINISSYISNNDIDRYNEISDRIQQMIWNMTNHETLLSDDDLKFIRNIPNKPDN